MNDGVVNKYYHLAMRDIVNGESLDELHAAIKFYETTENYEACAGIKKAIDEAEKSTIINLDNGH